MPLGGVTSTAPGVITPQTQPTHVDAPPREAHVVVEQDVKARASQSKIVEGLKQDLGDRNITSANLLSRDGIREVFGKTTFAAKVKDAFVHLLHKISDKLAPDSKGSHMMESKRLADRYQAQIRDGALLAERLATLEDLKKEISAHTGGAQSDKAKNFLKFVDHEITLLRNEPEHAAIDAFAHQETEKSLSERPEMTEQHSRLHGEIEGFDRSSLKHVDDPRAPKTDGNGTIDNPLKAEVPKWAETDIVANNLQDLHALGQDSKPITSHVDDVTEPSFSSLPEETRNNPTVSNAAATLTAAITNNDEGAQTQLLGELSTVLASGVRGSGSDAEFAFVTSDGAQFKSELLAELCRQDPNGGRGTLIDDKGKPTEKASALLDQLYNETGAKLSNHETSTGELVVNGKTYTKDRNLGQGGFGSVDLYKASDGSTLAVKRLIMDESEPSERAAKLKEACTEARNHHAVSGEGHSNVVKFEGAIRTSNGTMLIAMESAPRGSVFEFGEAIDKSVKDGLVSPRGAQIAKISLFKDLLRGMAHMQEGRGMSHSDVKEVNYFIGSDGLAKLGDFGTAKTNLAEDYTVRGKNAWQVDNPTWIAPEVLQGKQSVETTVNAEVERIMKPFKEQLDRGEITQAQFDSAKRALQKSDQIEAFRKTIPFQVTEKNDTWAVGVSAMHLFFGMENSPFNASFNFERENKIREFGSDPENRIRGLGVSGEGTGVTALDRILNRMLDPDPTQRPTLSDVLESGLFTEQDVDSDLARDLIKALTDKPQDPEKIKAASDAIGA